MAATPIAIPLPDALCFNSFICSKSPSHANNTGVNTPANNPCNPLSNSNCSAELINKYKHIDGKSINKVINTILFRPYRSDNIPPITLPIKLVKEYILTMNAANSWDAPNCNENGVMIGNWINKSINAIQINIYIFSMIKPPLFIYITYYKSFLE